MIYVIYELTTGKIQKTISTPTEIQIENNYIIGKQGYIKAEEHNPNTQNAVVDGVLTWIDTSLDDIKIIKKIEIDKIFDGVLLSKYSSYTTTGLTNNITINARRTDLENLKEVKLQLEEDNLPSVPFRCFDNSFVELTLSDVNIMIKELREYGFSLYRRKWTLLYLIDIATTKEEVDLVSWDMPLPESTTTTTTV